MCQEHQQLRGDRELRGEREMSVMDKLEQLFVEFHEDECPNSSRGIDFRSWAERAFEAVMGPEPKREEEDGIGREVSTNDVPRVRKNR